MSRLVPKLGSFYYKVMAGDTLFSIAKKFNTTVAIIQKFNTIKNKDMIYTGQTILIPQSPPEAIIYTVKSGDSLYLIALKYGTSVENIKAFNYLANPSIIYTGQELVITASLK